MRLLESKGLVIRVTRPINKNTEMMPLVRWQYRGLPEEARKAFFFENVVDSKGKKYDMPVLVASNAASTEIYALGMMCQPGEIMEKLAQAQRHPIVPVMVEKGPAQEVVYMGDRLIWGNPPGSSPAGTPLVTQSRVPATVILPQPAPTTMAASSIIPTKPTWVIWPLAALAICGAGFLFVAIWFYRKNHWR